MLKINLPRISRKLLQGHENSYVQKDHCVNDGFRRIKRQQRGVLSRAQRIQRFRSGRATKSVEGSESSA